MKRRNFIQMSTGVSLGSLGAKPFFPENLTDDALHAMDGRKIQVCRSVQDLKLLPKVTEGDWVKTLGFHFPGDGGEALYYIKNKGDDDIPNDADILTMRNGKLAILKESDSINYRMFGAKSDGISDDGVQIKLAHEYANRELLPVINLSGEFWISRTNDIPVKTSVQWGRTVFHIDERYNVWGVPRFNVGNDNPSLDMSNDTSLKELLIRELKPGVQIISGLAGFAGHLVLVQDVNDRIGIRAGYKGSKGWAREEFFYVEEEGRIIGDIAWEFKDITSIMIIPCNNNYLIIEGGCFYFSGDTPEGSTPGYHQNGIAINRSRTIIREQWMGLEPGKRDVSLEPRNGFYTFDKVYDVTLENIRAMPWEKMRRPPEPVVQHGTYGISGARMLNCTFRNLTAEGGWVAWGFFGTNLNKNFRLENCQLNRIDIHFHCWNLYINNCNIGFMGISVTGGGDLFVNETVRYGNYFIMFRPDYGAKWDGPIRLSGCTLKPSNAGRVSVLQMHPQDFDYQYSVGFGTSVTIEDMIIDYTAAPASADPCWLMNIASFSVNKHNQRLFFPQSLNFRNIRVTGREQGVRLIRIPDPGNYNLSREGGCDESRLRPNCILICDNVQLEKLIHDHPDDYDRTHLYIGGKDKIEYTLPDALYLKAVFRDCENVSFYLSQCATSIFLERCSINLVTASKLRGEINFNNCSFQPVVKIAEGEFYILESSFGTSFTNCTFHSPVVNGELAPHLTNNISFIKINKTLGYSHLNSNLGNEILKYLKEKGIVLQPAFIKKLKSHHMLESMYE